MLETQPEMATFRLGLFGLDKIKDAKKTVETIARGMDEALEGVSR